MGAGDGGSSAKTPTPVLLQPAAFLPWPDTDELLSLSAKLLLQTEVIRSGDDDELGGAERERKRGWERLCVRGMESPMWMIKNQIPFIHEPSPPLHFVRTNTGKH
uniref:Uncharacterized protein n=1 Tax=Oryza meridionalis TaxID=40149 RepID=A0A0E0E477_9ORYZ